MKKVFVLITSLYAFFLASCSQEEVLPTPETQTSAISFTVVLPDGIATRAISDGTQATKLFYAARPVGETDAYETVICGTGTFTNLAASVDLNLVTYMKYNIVFWAQNPNAPYTFDNNTQSVTIDYSTLTSNNEMYDAFYAAASNYEVKGPASNSIKLTRPFAQVNLATTQFDIDEAQKLNVHPVNTSMSVSGVYTKLNLVDGTVSDVQDVNFAPASIIDGETLKINDVDYKWLAMNYMLVPADQSLFDFQFSIQTNKGSIDYKLNNVPAQRNYKTNVYGDLITDSNKWDIVINPEMVIY